MNDLLAELIEGRDKVVEELRVREPALVAKMLQYNAAISGIQVGPGAIKQGEFSRFHKPSQAIFGYLDLMQKPQVREEMCKALVDGGYGGPKGNHYWILIRMVNYQIDKKRLVERNGLIGKPDWPKALFEAQK